MGMGRREKQRRQEQLWIAHTELPRTVAHPLLPIANSLVRSQPEALLREFRQRRRGSFGSLKSSVSTTGTIKTCPPTPRRAVLRPRRQRLLERQPKYSHWPRSSVGLELCQRARLRQLRGKVRFTRTMPLLSRPLSEVVPLGSYRKISTQGRRSRAYISKTLS